MYTVHIKPQTKHPKCFIKKIGLKIRFKSVICLNEIFTQTSELHISKYRSETRLTFDTVLHAIIILSLVKTKQ
jgi:hypothetical protein